MEFCLYEALFEFLSSSVFSKEYFMSHEDVSSPNMLRSYQQDRYMITSLATSYLISKAQETENKTHPLQLLERQADAILHSNLVTHSALLAQ